MNNLICIDPGNTSGWSWFYRTRLIRALAMPHDDLFNQSIATGYGRITLVLIEMPRVYPQKGKGDPNDIVDLAVKVGEVKRHYEERGTAVETVFPRTWKGTVDKDVHNQRVLERLDHDELARVPLRPRAKTPDHNCLDAIGLGLWKLGRLR